MINGCIWGVAGIYMISPVVLMAWERQKSVIITHTLLVLPKYSNPTRVRLSSFSRWRICLKLNSNVKVPNILLPPEFL